MDRTDLRVIFYEDSLIVRISASHFRGGKLESGATRGTHETQTPGKSITSSTFAAPRFGVIYFSRKGVGAWWILSFVSVRWCEETGPAM